MVSADESVDKSEETKRMEAKLKDSKDYDDKDN